MLFIERGRTRQGTFRGISASFLHILKKILGGKTMTKEAEMKNERIYKEGEKFKLAFCVNEIQEYVSPYNFATFEGEILGGLQMDLENQESITTLQSTEVFRGVLPIAEIESLDNTLFEADVEVCFDQDYEIYFLYVIEITDFKEKIIEILPNEHEEMFMGVITAVDGSKYYPDSNGGFIIKLPNDKETRISSFKNVIAVDGSIYSYDEQGELLDKGPDGKMHPAEAFLVGYLTSEDGLRYNLDYFREMGIELPIPEPFNSEEGQETKKEQATILYNSNPFDMYEHERRKMEIRENQIMGEKYTVRFSINRSEPITLTDRGTYSFQVLLLEKNPLDGKIIENDMSHYIDEFRGRLSAEVLIYDDEPFPQSYIIKDFIFLAIVEVCYDDVRDVFFFNIVEIEAVKKAIFMEGNHYYYSAYVVGEKFNIEFCLKEGAICLPGEKNIVAYNGYIFEDSLDRNENKKNLSTLGCLEMFCGTLPFNQIDSDSLDTTVIRATVEICSESVYDGIYLKIIEIHEEKQAIVEITVYYTWRGDTSIEAKYTPID